MENPVVRRYLATLETLRNPQFSLPDGQQSPGPSVHYRDLIRRCWAILREAAIFEIPLELYVSLYNTTDRYTTEVLSGLRWRPPDLTWSDPPPPEETDHLLKTVREEAQKIEMPEHLPFPACFLAYNPGVTLTPIMRGLYHMPEVDCMMYGHLIDSAGGVLTMIRAADPSIGYRRINVFPERLIITGKGWSWDQPLTFLPWILPSLIDWINDHKQVVEDKTSLFSYRSHYKSQAKKMGIKAPLPPPYYTIYLKDVRVEESTRETFQRRFRKVIDWQHRWQVRGHDCIRVRRGPLPLDPKLEAKLKKRKYRIYTLDKPDFDVYHALSVRGVQPKRTDEWLAVLNYWRDPFVKGPPDKPLIPGVRKSARKRYQQPDTGAR